MGLHRDRENQRQRLQGGGKGGGGGGGGGGGQGEDANVPRTLTGIILAVFGTFTHSQYHSTLARRIRRYTGQHAIHQLYACALLSVQMLPSLSFSSDSLRGNTERTEAPSATAAFGHKRKIYDLFLATNFKSFRSHLLETRVAEIIRSEKTTGDVLLCVCERTRTVFLIIFLQGF